MLNPTSRYVSVAHVARLLNVSPPTVRRWIRVGTLPAKRFPCGRFAIDRDDVILIFETARRPGAA